MVVQMGNVVGVTFVGEKKARSRLTSKEWVDEGLAAMARGGPDAVAIEPLAERLGATKGSGYWHFASRAELLKAVMQRWKVVATDDVIALIESLGGDATTRLSRLLTIVVDSTTDNPGTRLVLTHLEPIVADAVQEATLARVAYVRSLLMEAGIAVLEAQRRAVLGYSAYVGFAQLVATTPSLVSSLNPTGELADYGHTLVEFLLQPTTRLAVASTDRSIT